jgi:hypothetical protein
MKIYLIIVSLFVLINSILSLPQLTRHIADNQLIRNSLIIGTGIAIGAGSVHLYGKGEKDNLPRNKVLDSDNFAPKKNQIPNKKSFSS